jgi:hypothetical protein
MPCLSMRPLFLPGAVPESSLSPPTATWGEVADLIARLGRVRAVAALTHPGHTADLQPWVHEIIQLPKP